MFSYQGGPSVEVFTAQGNSSTCFANFKLSSSQFIQRVFDKELKSFCCDVTRNSSLTLPKNERISAQLVQPICVLQMLLPEGEMMSMDLRFIVQMFREKGLIISLTDTQGNRRRLILSTAVKDMKISPLHISKAYAGSTFKWLDHISFHGTFKLRRIFTLKEWKGKDNIPLKLDFHKDLHVATVIVDLPSQPAIIPVESVIKPFKATARATTSSKLPHPKATVSSTANSTLRTKAAVSPSSSSNTKSLLSLSKESSKQKIDRKSGISAAPPSKYSADQSGKETVRQANKKSNPKATHQSTSQSTKPIRKEPLARAVNETASKPSTAINTNQSIHKDYDPSKYSSHEYSQEDFPVHLTVFQQHHPLESDNNQVNECEAAFDKKETLGKRSDSTLVEDESGGGTSLARLQAEIDHFLSLRDSSCVDETMEEEGPPSRNEIETKSLAILADEPLTQSVPNQHDSAKLESPRDDPVTAVLMGISENNPEDNQTIPVKLPVTVVGMHNDNSSITFTSPQDTQLLSNHEEKLSKSTPDFPKTLEQSVVDAKCLFTQETQDLDFVVVHSRKSSFYETQPVQSTSLTRNVSGLSVMGRAEEMINYESDDVSDEESDMNDTLELVYDEEKKCYFDPNTQKYYKMTL